MYHLVLFNSLYLYCKTHFINRQLPKVHHRMNCYSLPQQRATSLQKKLKNGSKLKMYSHTCTALYVIINYTQTVK